MEWEPFIRLIAAAGFAGVIGLDRELRAKPAGLRTNIVVGVAAGAFAYSGMNAFPGGDPSRVAAQIVSGIGFLGGGAIFAAGGKPHGLTTAAALWGSAAAGLAAGVGAYTAGLALVAVTIVALWPLDWVASSLLGSRRRTDRRFSVVVRDLRAANTARALLHGVGVRVDYLDMRPFGVERVAMDVVVHATRAQIGEACHRLRVRDDVLFISEESVFRDEPPELSAIPQGQHRGDRHPDPGLQDDSRLASVRRRRRGGTGGVNAAGRRGRQRRLSRGRRTVAGKGAGSSRRSNTPLSIGAPRRPTRASATAETGSRTTIASTRNGGTVTRSPAALTSWHSTAPPSLSSTPLNGGRAQSRISRHVHLSEDRMPADLAMTSREPIEDLKRQ
ncbi:MAG: MgtC/SapB family protein [Actinomycetota bacterium]|nr:MgtC/SapB family protein [Actinomycetota bacterium]